ncbi:glycerol kinase GlpK [Terricaulis silvestris]|uniref:Glycerol kinase n=1 Tax=Terricaulis silvestris TaxID=2686094 RepID=A0A6I6MRV5_9CAUL|nr:glycerol kinase GlpK [Terricaulis silvestris]QGZ95537.1 Glycerol kinase [Terricaulis silvestris]
MNTSGKHILAIDQGTTSTRAIAFDLDFNPRATAQIELQQRYPQPGWVEHDAEEIWAATLKVCRDAIEQVGGAANIAAIGITNQRETTIIWDRKTGAPVHRAIVWQDRRTSDVCAALREAGHEKRVQQLTGLLLDPYFSGSKIAWILDHDPALRRRAEAGELAFGTVESFLVWRLTQGHTHASDITNASRTLVFDINTRVWSDEMCALLNVPRALLPEVRACDAHFGDADASLFGRAIPIHGIAGDQQAALVGHGCFEPGMAKATFGTGAFLVMNMGEAPPHSANRLLATVGYETKHGHAYALEGSIFSAGATMQWLRDGLKLIKTSADSEAIASALPDNGGVYLVPAFAGLGAPQWNAEARGTIVGLTRDSRLDHIVRAGLEAVAYQTADLLGALRADGAQISCLLIDGGLTANAWAMQFLADICDVEVARPAFQEVTALGTAKLAAFGSGAIPSLDSASSAPSVRWTSRIDADQRATLVAGWKKAVAATLAAATKH